MIKSFFTGQERIATLIQSPKKDNLEPRAVRNSGLGLQGTHRIYDFDDINISALGQMIDDPGYCFMKIML